MQASGGSRTSLSCIVSGSNSAELCPHRSFLGLHHLSPLPVRILASPCLPPELLLPEWQEETKGHPVSFSLELVQVFNEMQPRLPPETRPEHWAPAVPAHLPSNIPSLTAPPLIHPPLLLPPPLPPLSNRTFAPLAISASLNPGKAQPH